MSTKIYHGFRTGTNDLKVVLELVRTFRKEVWNPQAKAVQDTFIGAVMAGFTTYNDENRVKAWRLWMDARQEIKKTGFRNPAVDTDFSITLFPYEDHLLGIAYTEHYKWFNKFLKLPGIREFGYWDNTDQPEKITDAEWEKRRLAWDYVLGETSVPAKEGFAIDIHDTYILGEWT